ncbi:MAG: hypothetical protein WKF86_02930, partial [Acidimicrobiales bacterium]
PQLEALPPPSEPWEPWGRGARLLPQARGTDGMFLLRLRAPEERPPPPTSRRTLRRHAGRNGG